jgi:hypothetical protein
VRSFIRKKKGDQETTVREHFRNIITGKIEKTSSSSKEKHVMYCKPVLLKQA